MLASGGAWTAVVCEDLATATIHGSLFEALAPLCPPPHSRPTHPPPQLALEAVANGMCVVIGLQSTGEANTNAVRRGWGEGPGLHHFAWLHAWPAIRSKGLAKRHA